MRQRFKFRYLFSNSLPVVGSQLVYKKQKLYRLSFISRVSRNRCNSLARGTHCKLQEHSIYYWALKMMSRDHKSRLCLHISFQEPIRGRCQNHRSACKNVHRTLCGPKLCPDHLSQHHERRAARVELP